MLTVLDLFSGIGGMARGLEATGGFKTRWFCEIEAFPRLVLAKHWPGVPIFEDVRTLSAESLGGLRPDCIVGGFPCQDISVAGKGKGLHGHRSGLWFEFARLVEELGPRWVIAENVGALRTRGVDRVCSDLEAEGYAVWPLLVGAWAVGAPHKRERVWIVAHRDGDGRDRDNSLRFPRGVGSAERRHESEESESGRTSAQPPRNGALGASELDNSDAGRRGRTEHALQAGRDKPERPASGVGLADPHRGRPQDERYTQVGHHADGRGERPVGEPTGSGLEGQRADAGEPQEPEPRHAGALSLPESGRRAQQGDGRDAGSRLGCDGPRWPARPGEPQHEWEEPRLAYGSGDGRATATGTGSTGEGEGERRLREPAGTSSGGERCPQLPLGGSAHGLSLRLARRANRESLKALGNSVVPQVVYAIGRAILAVEASVTAPHAGEGER